MPAPVWLLRRRTNRTEAAAACFSTNLVRRRLNEFAPQVTDQMMETTRTGEGLAARSAKERQRVAVKLTRRFASEFSGIQPGRTKGVRSRPSRFSYESLRDAVVQLETNGIASQIEVAKYLGYKGTNADDQLRRDLGRRQDELKRHGHTGHRWKILVDEILSRDK